MTPDPTASNYEAALSLYRNLMSLEPEYADALRLLIGDLTNDLRPLFEQHPPRMHDLEPTTALAFTAAWATWQQMAEFLKEVPRPLRPAPRPPRIV